MKRTPRTQQQRRDETSQAVLASATNLFGAGGYQATSLEEIAQASGTTIRPIYHYFGNKLNLFQAVTEQMEERLYLALLAVEKDHEGPIAVVDYWSTFMAFARDPGFRQIVLVDAFQK